jgi:acetyl coenzyme A synthetase (ADP forming)-like protein
MHVPSDEREAGQAGGREVVLRDGGTAWIRAAAPGDAGELRELYRGLSEESREARFFGLVSEEVLARHAERQCRIEPGRTNAVVATAGPSGGIVGHACYQAVGLQPAEASFTVADAWQGKGLGTHLIGELARAATHDDVPLLRAIVRPSNHRMVAALRDSGFSVRVRPEPDRIVIDFPSQMTEDALESFEEREWSSVSAAVEGFLKPRTVAVVGASRRPDTIGGAIFHNLLAYGFTGTVLPVNASADSVQGVKAYRTVDDAPRPIDLAVIAVPAAEVVETVRRAADAGAERAIIISAGFAEAGPQGALRQEALLEVCRSRGVRVIGPNCMGVVNTAPEVRLNATFAPTPPLEGRLAFMSQSGALGLAIMDHASRIGLGLSSFVSVGNKADVSSNDLIQYWAEDAQTSVILLYLESFGNPKKFAEIARRVGRKKPIVAVKAGRSMAGSRAAASHTGALASNDVVVDALFRQAGVIRTERLEEMFDVATLLSHQPIPRGARVAILTNAGGPGILAADACEAHGLQLPPLSDATRAELRSFLPAAASVSNPVDMLASAPADHYGRALTAILGDESIDSVITIFIPPLVTEPDSVAAAIATAARGTRDKPVLGVFMRSTGAPAALAPIPSYAFPEAAALALARATAYGQWRTKPIIPAPPLDRLDPVEIRRIVDRVLARGPGWASSDEAQSLLAASGIAAAASRVVTSVADALEAASQLGFPIALKALGPTLLHKTERRAVTLNIGDEAGLRTAFADFTTRFGHDMTGALVQQMVPHGVEMIVGALHDPIFGPLIACGTGGVLVDVLADTAFRLHPLNATDAGEMIDELRGARLLRGYRGSPPADETALRDVLLRVSELVRVAPEIQELDLNPVIVLSSGARVADVRVRIDATTPPKRGRRVEY